ncbi:MAG: hypothetical protein AAGG38_14245 [Planctomycetota bacterium]
MSAGGVPFTELIARAQATGIAKTTLKRARHKARVAVFREATATAAEGLLYGASSPANNETSGNATPPGFG